MTSDNDLLLKGPRIIIPIALRESFLHNIHEEQAVISMCHIMARSHIYWPGINRDIEDCIKKLPACIRFLPTLSAEPLIKYVIPQGFWQKIGADFMYWHKKRLFLKTPFPFQMSSTTMTVAIDYLTEPFALKEMPLEASTGNKQHYSSKQSYTFADKYGFKHTTSTLLPSVQCLH